MLRHIVSYDGYWNPLARRLGPRMTRAEALLWAELKGRKLLGRRFLRRQLVDRYTVDFFCKELSFAIEIDAGAAAGRPRADDEERTIRLRLCGVAVVRFTEEEIVHNLDGVVVRIRHAMRYLPWK